LDRLIRGRPNTKPDPDALAGYEGFPTEFKGFTEPKGKKIQAESLDADILFAGHEARIAWNLILSS
jgi:hypothetical protein